MLVLSRKLMERIDVQVFEQRFPAPQVSERVGCSRTHAGVFAANHRLCQPLWEAASVLLDAPSSVTFLFVQNSPESGVYCLLV